MPPSNTGMLRMDIAGTRIHAKIYLDALLSIPFELQCHKSRAEPGAQQVTQHQDFCPSCCRLFSSASLYPWTNPSDTMTSCSGCRYFSFIHAVVVTSLNFYILLATKTFDDSPSSKVRAFLHGKLPPGSLLQIQTPQNQTSDTS